ncbi:hypothetical protein ZWY2020_025517 [Hordeum vulgare]|nr:hypothetical protein ZWY2020_025517 [Hordeum vulgare]
MESDAWMSMVVSVITLMVGCETETDALDEHGGIGDPANGGEQKMETPALGEHYVDGGGDEEQMDCNISSMVEQVPRVVSKSTSETEAEATIGPDTNESTIESNISETLMPKPANYVPINIGDDLLEKMDRDKSAEQLLIESEKMATEQEEFAQYVDAWDCEWGSNGFALF